MSQRSKEPSQPKTSRKVRSAKNESNQFIYDKFDSLRKAAMMRNNKNVVNCYAKILRSLEKYPLPILSAQQAITLDGVGAKMAALIGNIIQKKKNENPNNENSQSNENNKENEEDYDEVNTMQFSQTSQWTRFIENDINAGGNSLSQDQEFGLKKASFQISKYINEPKKRGRDETDLPSILQQPLRKSHTLDNPMLQGLEEEDMYGGDYNDNLWSTDDFPTTSAAVEEPSSSNKFLSLNQKAGGTGKKLKKYKPEKNSTGFNILIGLLKFEGETKKKYATKKEIKQSLKNAKEEIGDLLISNWTAMNTLLKYDLVSNFQFNDEEKYSLSDTGFTTASDCYVLLLQEKENPVPIPSTTSAKDVKNSDAMIIENSSNNPSSNSNSATTADLNTESNNGAKDVEFFDYSKFDFSKTIKKSQTKSILKSMHSFTEEKVIAAAKTERESDNTVNFTLYEKLSTEKRKTYTEQEEDDQDEEVKVVEKEPTTPFKEVEEKDPNTQAYNHIVEKSKIIGNWNLVLLVDNREIRNKKERDFFYEKFQENGVNCKLVNLNLGDFLWTVEIGEGRDKATYVLDYIIERKTADDLAASILDKRYNQQKFRLQNSNIKNIFYLVEGKVSQHANLPQSTINKAVLNTQVVQNFKVRTTQSLQESIRLITEMHIAIEGKFAQDLNNFSQDYTCFKYKFEEYQAVVSKSQGLTNKIHFGNMLRLIKGCGKENVAMILEKFDTLFDFYNTLKKLDGETERLEFLGQVKKPKGRGKKALAMMATTQVEPELHLNKTVANHIIKLFFEESYPRVAGNTVSDLAEEISGNDV